MKKFLLLLLFALGCAAPNSPPNRESEPPREIMPGPPAPACPSSQFMTGYWDGYSGKWLSPFRWTFSDDYRNGHEVGSYDREHHIERYQRT